MAIASSRPTAPARGNSRPPTSAIATPCAWIVQLELSCDQPSIPSPPLTLLEPQHLSWFAPGNTFPSYARTLGGGHNEKLYPPHAFRLDTLRLDPGALHWTENGWDGRSSNKDMPMLISAVGQNALVGALEWSGYWWGSTARGSGQDYTLQIKIPISGIRLQPGEKLTLPAAHYVFASGALDGEPNAFRRYLNHHILPTLAGRAMQPVVNYNHWFGLEPNINERTMFRQVDLAAKAGVEYFILDAGWYAGCRGGDFEPGVGNLETVDQTKFPRGLKPLAQRIRSAGMQMGLWFELERAHRTSDWATCHPDWFIDIGRDYLHLDLSVPEAQDACIRVMASAIKDLGLKWLKLDYNIGPKPFWDHKDPTGRIQFTYLEGLYRVLDEVRRICPDVIMECCASGGRRLDLAMLRRAHIAWISDEAMSSENVRYMLAAPVTSCPGNSTTNASPSATLKAAPPSATTTSPAGCSARSPFTAT